MPTIELIESSLNEKKKEEKTHLDRSDAADEGHDVAQHVVGIDEQGERVGHVERADFHGEVRDREEKNEVELDRPELPEPLLHRHDSVYVYSLSVYTSTRTADPRVCHPPIGSRS